MVVWLYVCASVCAYVQVGRLDVEAFREIVGPSHVVTEGSALEAANGMVETGWMAAGCSSGSVRMEKLGRVLLLL